MSTQRLYAGSAVLPSGKMLFIVGETEFKNQRGEVVAYSRNTVIETEGPVMG